MSEQQRVGRSVIGICPECGSEISAGQTLISYQRQGEEACYADCASCRTVVHPA